MESNKTVLYVGGFELPDKNAAAQRVLANADILKKLGYKVIFVGIDKCLDNRIPFEKTKTETGGFTHYRKKYPVSLPEWLYYLTDISYINHFQPDIVIAYNYPAFALEKLRKWCKRHHAKIIADCTEWYEPQGNILFKIIKGMDIHFRMKVIHPKLDGMIAISHYLYTYYTSRMKNVFQLPPLVDKQAGKWKMEKDDEIPDRIRLIYVGSPGPGNKDRLDIIINALEKIKRKYLLNFNFRIIGLTKEQYCKIYNINTLPPYCENCVEFKGRVSHTEALNYLANSDFQIFIRQNNLTNTAGFPTKFVEATSCGIPVLTNFSSDLKNYLFCQENGFLLDISSMDNLIHSLLIPLQLSKEERIRLKTTCRQFEDTFDYRNYISGFEDFLSSVNAIKS